MKINLWPVVAFATLTGFTSFSNAGLFGIGCDWKNNPVDIAVAQYERLTTPLPKGLNRKVIPFRESDFRTKPWIAAYEYVIVVNNTSPYVHHTELPSKMPFIDLSLKALGIEDTTRSNWTSNTDENIENAKIFLQNYSAEADKIRRFGEVIYTRNGRNQMTPMKNENPGEAQTVRVYHRGQLIRYAKISTGRGSFQLRGRQADCDKPLESYHTYTEPGYYNFQELLKEYRSKSYDADMPNAMFYNRGRGLALHEVNVPQKLEQLGTRASGGCTRMDPDTAHDLFERIAMTEGASIPEIDVYGNPVYNAAGQRTFKNTETIIYGEGTSREQRTFRRSYNALLIIQPDSVVDANPAQDKAARFIYQSR